MPTRPAAHSPRPTRRTHRSAGASTVVILLAGILIALVAVVVLLVVLVTSKHPEPQPIINNVSLPPAAAQPAELSPPPVAITRDAFVTPQSAHRSPIPQPGETITKPILTTVLGGSANNTSPTPTTPTAPPPVDGAIIPWQSAHQYVGQTITVEGQILDTYNTGTVCFLNFTRDKKGFYIILFKETLAAWPESPDVFFLNKTVRITGEVSPRSGRTQIQVRQPSQITVVE